MSLKTQQHKLYHSSSSWVIKIMSLMVKVAKHSISSKRSSKYSCTLKTWATLAKQPQYWMWWDATTPIKQLIKWRESHFHLVTINYHWCLKYLYSRVITSSRTWSGISQASYLSSLVAKPYPISKDNSYYCNKMMLMMIILTTTATWKIIIIPILSFRSTIITNLMDQWQNAKQRVWQE